MTVPFQPSWEILGPLLFSSSIGLPSPRPKERKLILDSPSLDDEGQVKCAAGSREIQMAPLLKPLTLPLVFALALHSGVDMGERVKASTDLDVAHIYPSIGLTGAWEPATRIETAQAERQTDRPIPSN